MTALQTYHIICSMLFLILAGVGLSLMIDYIGENRPGRVWFLALSSLFLIAAGIFIIFHTISTIGA
jgi:hypothetical protein